MAKSSTRPIAARRVLAVASADPQLAELSIDVEQGLQTVDGAMPQKPPNADKKFDSSARYWILASAFRRATDGPIRSRLNCREALAVLIVVPGHGWIGPVRNLFVARFGGHWQTVVPSVLAATPQQKSERHTELATWLARGQSVLGIAVRADALPSVLKTAADLTIHIGLPDAALISNAIRMFIGARPVGVDVKLASGMECHDLLAALRKVPLHPRLSTACRSLKRRSEATDGLNDYRCSRTSSSIGDPGRPCIKKEEVS